MRKFLCLVAVCFLSISLAIAQTATVKRNVVLRSKASSTSTAITTLKPPATLALINPAARNGFLHVTTDDGDNGWVYAKNVEVSDEEDAGEPWTLAQVNSGDVLVGTMLAAGFDMGVNTSEGMHDWLEKNTEEGYFKLAYPSGQSWGAVFITVGKPTVPPRPSKDLSEYQTLSVEMKPEAGTKVVDIGIKTSTQPDDGSETKIPVKLVPDWKTYELRLKRFEGTDLRNLYVVAEFVFAGSEAQTVYVRNLKYLARPAQGSRGSEIPTTEFVSAEKAVQVQAWFMKTMDRTVEEFNREVAKVPLVKMPTSGKLMFDDPSLGYRTTDLSQLWKATRQLLLRASDLPELSGMSAYVSAFFPSNPYKESRVVSQSDGRSFISTLASFVTKVSQTAQLLRIDFTFQSSPEPAILSLSTGGGIPLPRKRSPAVITNVFRGFYSYSVEATGYKRIDEQLNLIDEDIHELDCLLVSAAAPQAALPCSTSN